MKTFLVLAALVVAFVLPGAAQARDIQPANEDGGSASCYWNSFWSHTYYEGYEPNYLNSGFGVHWWFRIECSAGAYYFQRWYTV